MTYFMQRIALSFMVLAAHHSAVIAQTNPDTPPAHSYHIGDTAMGGIVIWVDEAGQHGLIAATHDQVLNIPWWNGAQNLSVTNAHATGIGAGRTNTVLIVSRLSQDDPEGVFAALGCAYFSVQADGEKPCDDGGSGKACYADWYLPSLFELNLMYHQKVHIPVLDGDYYWSSTEDIERPYFRAWSIRFGDGHVSSETKLSSHTVHCVRQF